MRILTLVIVLLISVISAYSSTSQWIISNIRLTPKDEMTRDLTALVSKGKHGETIHLSTAVPLTSIEHYFASGNKLAILGHAGNADAVVILDVMRKRQIDWFYCYQPRQISADYIAYIEWYPNHTSERITDVVLVYDLKRDPLENRVGSKQHSPLSSELVGVPIYPEQNALNKRYANVVPDQNQVRLVLGGTGIVALPDNKVVFSVAEEPGGDARSIKDYLVFIDISKGLTNPIITNVKIPTDTFSKPAQGSEFVRIESIAVYSPTTVKLNLSKNEYGVDSALVTIP